MTDDAQHPKASDIQTLLPSNFEATQDHNTALMTRASAVMVDTARAVWERQMELFRLESEQLANILVPFAGGEDPAAKVSAWGERWQEDSEKLINRMRAVNDIVRKCGWELFRIYQESLREAIRPSQERSR